MLGKVEKDKFVKISAVLPRSWAEFIREKAEQNDCSMTKILRMALESYFLGELK